MKTDLDTYISKVRRVNATENSNMLAIQCLDLTTLNDNDTEDDIREICQRALTPLGNVAAICIPPQFVDFAKRHLVDSSIHIATVANFPTGDEPLESVMADIKNDIFDGANEIDVVFPYTAYLNDKKQAAIELIKAARETCGDITLKVILETGALNDLDTIKAVSIACLEAGADFLKTSTGTSKVGATFAAAATMLDVIKQYQHSNVRTVGLKVSGGVSTPELAAQYISLANSIMGNDWVSGQTFRIGASSLLSELVS